MKKLLTIILSLATASIFLMPTLAFAAAPSASVCEGIGATTGAAGCADTPGTPTADSILVSALNVISIAVAVAAVIMVMIGGAKYVMSGGDSNSVSSAKNTILFAVIGLVVAAMSQILVKFVLTRIKK